MTSPPEHPVGGRPDEHGAPDHVPSGTRQDRLGHVLRREAERHVADPDALVREVRRRTADRRPRAVGIGRPWLVPLVAAAVVALVIAGASVGLRLLGPGALPVAEGPVDLPLEVQRLSGDEIIEVGDDDARDWLVPAGSADATDGNRRDVSSPVLAVRGLGRLTPESMAGPFTVQWTGGGTPQRTGAIFGTQLETQRLPGVAEAGLRAVVAEGAQGRVVQAYVSVAYRPATVEVRQAGRLVERQRVRPVDDPLDEGYLVSVGLPGSPTTERVTIDLLPQDRGSVGISAVVLR